MTQKHTYLYHIGNLPSNHALEHPGILYYSNTYLSLHQFNHLEKHYLISMSEEKVEGMFFYTNDKNGNHTSIDFAPFGSFIIDESIPLKDLIDWVQYCITSSLVIKHYAPIYGKKASQAMEKIGYRDKVIEINHHIELTNFDLGSLHGMQRRRIQKCLNAGFSFQQVCSEKAVEDTYDFLKKCRSDQGLEINISREKLLESFKNMPQQYYSFLILNEEEIIAASIVVQINEKIVYNYLPGSNKIYAKYSPMAFLLYQISLYFQQKSFRYLDLGIASINGKEQIGLALFKERMGGVRTEKPTYYF